MAEAALFCVLGDAGPADGCAQDFLELLGDLAGAAALGEPFADEVGVGVEFAAARFAGGAAELDAAGGGGGHSALDAGGDHFVLEVGEVGEEGRLEHAVAAAVEALSGFGVEEGDAALVEEGHELLDVGHGAADAAELGDDDGGALGDGAGHAADGALFPGDFSADVFFVGDVPLGYGEVVALAECEELEELGGGAL